jgi:hypothetical protein
MLTPVASTLPPSASSGRDKGVVTGEFFYLLVRSFVWALCMALATRITEAAPRAHHQVYQVEVPAPTKDLPNPLEEDEQTAREWSAPGAYSACLQT